MLRLFRTFVLIAILLGLSSEAPSNASTLECDSKKCLQKCCDWGHVYIHEDVNETLKCVPGNRLEHYPILENISRIASNNMPCDRSTQFPVLIPIEVVTIFDNSSMMNGEFETETLFQPSGFCLEQKDGELNVLICINKTMVSPGYLDHIVYSKYY